MISAAIDIGTNSTRLLIAEYINEKIIPIYTDLHITRIGEGMGASKEIKPWILERTINCLRQYKEICLQYNVDTIRVVATSAVRDAENKRWVVERIKEETGLDVEILSGSEEARLSYLGAISGYSSQETKPVVIDIGGGSTELIYSTNEAAIVYKSMDLGAVRLKENQALLGKVGEILDQAITTDFPHSFTLIGVGGTITTLAAIKLELDKYDPELVEGYTLSYSDAQAIYANLKAMSLEERKSLKGLQPQRADIIPYGTLILLETLKRLHRCSITVSEKDILYGIIITTKKGKS